MLKTLFIYDWDDNIMFMPSILHIEKLIGTKWTPMDATPAQWAKIKNNANIRDLGDESFFDFHDDKSFVLHLSQAIHDLEFGPAYKAFKKTLINGEDFAILTARGHSPNTVMTGVMMLIFRTFSENEIIEMMETVGDIGRYLEQQEYFTVSSKEFNNRFGTDNTGRTKDKKAIALYNYISEKIHYNSSLVEPKKWKKLYSDFNVVFSDDDVDNVEAAVELFHKLKVTHPNVEFKIFDTSKKKTKEITI